MVTISINLFPKYFKKKPNQIKKRITILNDDALIQ